MTPEIHKELKDFPEHHYHWEFDKFNRWQRKIMPAKNITAFLDQINFIQETVNKPDSEQIFATFPPVYMLLGEKDQVVENDIPKEVFEKMQVQGKCLVVEPELDHNPFSDGTKYKEYVASWVQWMQTL